LLAPALVGLRLTESGTCICGPTRGTKHRRRSSTVREVGSCERDLLRVIHLPVRVGHGRKVSHVRGPLERVAGSRLGGELARAGDEAASGHSRPDARYTRLLTRRSFDGAPAAAPRPTDPCPGAPPACGARAEGRPRVNRAEMQTAADAPPRTFMCSGSTLDASALPLAMSSIACGAWKGKRTWR
jgi:hypothetical protein